MLIVLGPLYSNYLLIITPQTVTTLHSYLEAAPIKPWLLNLLSLFQVHCPQVLLLCHSFLNLSTKIIHRL